MNPGLNGVILREAYTMAVSAFGLLILAAAVLFYIPLVAKMGVPRLIIGLFFILLCLLAMILGLSLPSQLSNTLVRLGAGDAAGYPVRHQPEPRPADRHHRRPDRRPAVHRVWHVRLHGAVFRDCGRPCDRGGDGLALRPAAQPPQGQRDERHHLRRLLRRFADVHRVAGASVQEPDYEVAAGQRPAHHHWFADLLPPRAQRFPLL